MSVQGWRMGELLMEHEGSIETIWVECGRCGARREFKVKHPVGDYGGETRVSDEEAARRFRQLGWRLRRGRKSVCPSCVVEGQR